MQIMSYFYSELTGGFFNPTFIPKIDLLQSILSNLLLSHKKDAQQQDSGLISRFRIPDSLFVCVSNQVGLSVPTIRLHTTYCNTWDMAWGDGPEVGSEGN